MTPEFELVNSVFGYGDPGNPEKRGVWFVGIEEAESWGKTVEEVRRRYAAVETHLVNQFVIDEENQGKFKGQIEQYISKIVCVFSPETHVAFSSVLGSRTLCWEESQVWHFYRRKFLWRQGAGICNANLFPLGKAGTSEWPPENKEIFGYGEKDLDLYKEYVRGTRFAKMRDCWERCQPRVTICYVGKNHQDDINKLFGVKRSEWTQHSDDVNVLCHETKRLLLTAHFSRQPWSNAMAGVIQKKLSEWGVILPR